MENYKKATEIEIEPISSFYPNGDETSQAESESERTIVTACSQELVILSVCQQICTQLERIWNDIGITDSRERQCHCAIDCTPELDFGSLFTSINSSQLNPSGVVVLPF